jgi:hypothetical protein
VLWILHTARSKSRSPYVETEIICTRQWLSYN